MSSPSSSTLGSNPFREASLDFGPSLRSTATGSTPLTSPEPEPSPSDRPALPSRPSELARELAAAMSEEEMPAPAVTPAEMGRSTSASRQEGEKSPTLLQQFRTGSGWFAPLVPAEAPLTREERAAKEKARIEALKAGEGAARRPNLLKRMSSGVELFGYGGMGSPTK
ncbi:hypothetical protein JCM10213_007661 [Rhodosporidiobolus nylandii]